jgi:DNA end-binding protein Ku
VKTKIEGGDIKRTPTSTKSSGEVVDLLAALQRSVDAAKTARGEDDDEKPAQKSGTKKASTAKKASAKKSAAKKAPAKKAAAKKSTAKKAAKKAPARKAS